MYQCDLDLNMKYFQGEYLSYPNSDDLYDPEIPLKKLVPVSSSSFLPIMFSPPNCPLSIHICVYLPTAGKEWEFIDALSMMILCIKQLREKHPEAIFYIRGDFNASSRNIPVKSPAQILL